MLHNCREFSVRQFSRTLRQQAVAWVLPGVRLSAHIQLNHNLIREVLRWVVHYAAVGTGVGDVVQQYLKRLGVQRSLEHRDVGS